MKLLQSDIKSMADWCHQNSLTLNSKKTQAIFFGNKTFTDPAFQQFPHISTGIGEIEVVKLVSNLGVLMNSAMTWETQIVSVSNKIKTVLYRLRRISAFTNTDTRCKLTQTLIFPLLDYCSAIYGDLSGRLDSKLQTAFNSCVRYVYDLDWRTHITPHRIKLN